MPKSSHRETILTEGLGVVLERGFCGASVRDVVQAAGVPPGSFTNHFASKEAFGLEILDLCFTQVREGIRKTLRNDSLIGNFSIEAADHSQAIRRRLVEIFVQPRCRRCHGFVGSPMDPMTLMIAVAEAQRAIEAG